MEQISATRDFMIFEGFDLDGRTQQMRGYWLSVRPCPKCGRTMLTNGKGFFCLRCDSLSRVRRVVS